MDPVVNAPDVVRESGKRSLSHSFFPLKQVRETTEQFGLVKPHVVFDANADENFKYRADYRTKSYTLKAPLMQDVHRYLTYIKVDMPAILPINFEKFFTNPVVGQDVPADVSCVLLDGYRLIFNGVYSCFNKYLGDFYNLQVSDAPTVVKSTFASALRALLFGEFFYSRGSLLSSLGCRLASQFTFFSSADQDSLMYKDYDAFFDAFCSWASSHFSKFDVQIDGITYRVGGDSSESISFLHFLDLIRDTSSWSFPSDGSFVYNLDDMPDLDLANISYRGPSNAPFNFSRACAYQLAISEFMTNDHVDNIYSAELYRSYILELLRSFFGDSVFITRAYFSINGRSYQFDALSGHFMYYLFTFVSQSASNLLNPAFLQYFISLFGYRRSLRYKDYFVSSRVNPLAVGDVSVNVQSNAVSVVDVSRKIQIQRFLNRVNRVGRNFSNYIRGIFGVDVAPDRHVPHFLAELDELVYASEVENTADAQQTKQNSVTAVFTGNSSNKEIEFFTDVPCIIIGLTSYDIERSYTDSIERSFFVRDRFDMFLPELQFVGDQPVYQQELDSSIASEFGSAFAYQYRDMQYKLMYNVADGGFVNYLPGYAFMFVQGIRGSSRLSSSFLRSSPFELDGFYLSMTGFSLASRFHFISLITNHIDASRPMIANPKILE